MNPTLSLFLLCLLLTSPTVAVRREVGYIVQNSPKDHLRNHFQANGGQCLTGNLYNLVRKNDTAMSYYIDAVCSLRQNETAKEYMALNFGTYVENLGAGSFGVVDKYEAPNGTFYAVKKPKTFKINLLFEELNASACIRELLGKQCDLEKNFAMIIQCVKHDSPKVNLIMQFYPSTLEDKIKSKYTKRYDLRTDTEKLEVLGDMKVITEEVKLMHSVRLAHRDLKPENVMMDKDGRPIMVDFGFTTPNFDLARTNAGTPLYMDYLIYQKKANGQLSDLYALAIIFFEMTNGPESKKVIEKMVRAGGWPNITYFPSMSMLGLLPEFAWLAQFTTKTNRWSIDQMLERIGQMIGEVQSSIDQKEKLTLIDVQPKRKNSFSVGLDFKTQANHLSPKFDRPFNGQEADDLIKKYQHLITHKVQPVYDVEPVQNNHRDVYSQPKSGNILMEPNYMPAKLDNFGQMYVKKDYTPELDTKPIKMNYDFFQKPENVMLNNITRNIDTKRVPLKMYTPTNQLYSVQQQPSFTYYRKVTTRKITPPNMMMGYPNYQFNNQRPYYII